MPELFMKYPVGSMVEYDDCTYQVLGYEMYEGKRMLICKKGEMGFRLNVNCLENYE